MKFCQVIETSKEFLKWLLLQLVPGPLSPAFSFELCPLCFTEGTFVLVIIFAVAFVRLVSALYRRLPARVSIFFPSLDGRWEVSVFLRSVSEK